MRRCRGALDATAAPPCPALPCPRPWQAARALMRYTWWEVDVYRSTRRFPSLPFARLLLLARTLLSAAMMLLYRLQAGGGGLGGAR